MVSWRLVLAAGWIVFSVLKHGLCTDWTTDLSACDRFASSWNDGSSTCANLLSSHSLAPPLTWSSVRWQESHGVNISGGLQLCPVSLIVTAASKTSALLQLQLNVLHSHFGLLLNKQTSVSWRLQFPPWRLNFPMYCICLLPQSCYLCYFVWRVMSSLYCLPSYRWTRVMTASAIIFLTWRLWRRVVFFTDVLTLKVVKLQIKHKYEITEMYTTHQSHSL